MGPLAAVRHSRQGTYPFTGRAVDGPDGNQQLRQSQIWRSVSTARQSAPVLLPAVRTGSRESGTSGGGESRGTGARHGGAYPCGGAVYGAVQEIDSRPWRALFPRRG